MKLSTDLQIRYLKRRYRRTLQPLGDEAAVTMAIYGYGSDPVFPAVLDSENWNGFAVPRFRRDVADVVVKWLNLVHADMPDASASARWDGDTVVITESQWEDEPGYTPDRETPDDDGRYCIGGRAWMWDTAQT